jgi:hypothetical protein
MSACVKYLQPLFPILLDSKYNQSYIILGRLGIAIEFWKR